MSIFTSDKPNEPAARRYAITARRVPSVSANGKIERPRVRGKFLFLGNNKFWVRGVTYGTFRPNTSGVEYPEADMLELDLQNIRANGFNAIRTYTMPPRCFFDAASRHGLYVIVGLPWEQHVTFLEDKKQAREIEKRLFREVHTCAGHPAAMGYAIGNEIPASIVRWFGHRRVERFLERLYGVVKVADPEAIVTYVNYPTTEYLDLPFLDLVTFNVYLESEERLQAYLARLQTLAGDRPLIMSEIGLDSFRHGEEKQAHVLDWQLKKTFESGCAGAFIFSWTDEWNRGGADIENWAFGITTRDRRPKLALQTVRQALAQVPFPRELPWPKTSVIVCTYNGSRTLRNCLEALLYLDYPNFEVIVVDDGSIDSTSKIANSYGFRVIKTENQGLSAARNTGLKAATGEIVAYLDDDAYPDSHWLRYFAANFMKTKHVALGGPNILPPGDGTIAQCVAYSPGNPVHILLSDTEAEHIPGCNMAFRKSALEAIGGFDPDFRIAGDDVDVCWRLQQSGWTIGFIPGAMVWHHRRNSIRAYWKQQFNYGRAEALLEEKWPEKYNVLGHLTWAGRVYGKGHRYKAWRRGRIYHGVWGSAPFQSIYQSPVGALESWLSMPEWYLAIMALAPICVLGFLWPPLFYALPLLALAVTAPVYQAISSASHVCLPAANRSRFNGFKLRSVIALFHLVQPLARLTGRLRSGLTLWRNRSSTFFPPWPRNGAIWSENWRDPIERLRSLESALQKSVTHVRRGGEYDNWDLEVRPGLYGSARILMAVEEHGFGKQFTRFRVWPRCSFVELLPMVVFGSLSLGAAIQQAWAVSGIFGIIAIWFISLAFGGCGSAITAVLKEIRGMEKDERDGKSQERP